jgi:peptidoglycan/LPS O-acetylase OafA/YrhL
MRRFEIGPLLVAISALVLLVSLFLDWYGDQTAWGAFEVSDVLLAVLALGALVVALGLVLPEIAFMDRRWLAPLALGAAILVAAQLLSPPPNVGDADPQTGAWLGFAASLVMLAGMVLTVSHVSFSMAIEGREPRQRVAAVDHRPPTTETGSVVPQSRPAADETAATVAQPDSVTRRRGGSGT